MTECFFLKNKLLVVGNLILQAREERDFAHRNQVKRRLATFYLGSKGEWQQTSGQLKKPTEEGERGKYNCKLGYEGGAHEALLEWGKKKEQRDKKLKD